MLVGGAVVALVAAGGVVLLVRNAKTQPVDGAAGLVTPVASESTSASPLHRETLASPPSLVETSAHPLTREPQAPSAERDGSAVTATRKSDPVRASLLPPAAHPSAAATSAPGAAASAKPIAAASASEQAPAPSQTPATPSADPLDGRR
jgi:hypothetical protein